jgi:hypothetical protein
LLEPTLAATSSGEPSAGVGNIRLCYETFGSLDAQPLLLTWA